MRKAVILGFTVLFLASCGFHLRGLKDVPKWLDKVYIDNKTRDGELLSVLKVQLKNYKIHVNLDPASAKYWLVINDSSHYQQIISIGASTNARQYQLILTVVYTLRTSKGKELIPNSLIKVTRQITMNNNRILGSSEEEITLLKEMRQDAVVQMINQLHIYHQY